MRSGGGASRRWSDVNCFQPRKYLFKLEKLQEDELSLDLIHYCKGIYRDLIGNASAEEKGDSLRDRHASVRRFLRHLETDEATGKKKPLDANLALLLSELNPNSGTAQRSNPRTFTTRGRRLPPSSERPGSTSITVKTSWRTFPRGRRRRSYMWTCG